MCLPTVLLSYCSPLPSRWLAQVGGSVPVEIINIATSGALHAMFLALRRYLERATTR